MIAGFEEGYKRRLAWTIKRRLPKMPLFHATARVGQGGNAPCNQLGTLRYGIHVRGRATDNAQFGKWKFPMPDRRSWNGTTSRT